MSYEQIWNALAAVDCSKHIEKKGNLSYLSWAWAWAELMKLFPAAQYEFKEPVTFQDGTVEIWCSVSIDECRRDMWLPVMDHRNNSIVKPSTRQVSDTRMRCLVKCLAMFGLGHYIYAGEDLPDPEVAAMKVENDYKFLCDELFNHIEAIKEGIRENDLKRASTAWQELTEEQKLALWKAPKNGGIFTTEERNVMKSKEFREALIK